MGSPKKVYKVACHLWIPPTKPIDLEPGFFYLRLSLFNLGLETPVGEKKGVGVVEKYFQDTSLYAFAIRVSRL